MARTMTDEGLTYHGQLLNGEISAVGTWYLAPFGNNYVPDGSETAATAPGLAGELTNYEGVRKEFNGTFTLSGGGNAQIANTSSKASFTFDAPTMVYGVIMTSVSTKGSTSGIARYIIRDDSPRMASANVPFDVEVVLPLIGL